MGAEDDFFDDLQRRADALERDPDRDNEATRHDLLVYPLLTSPFGLQWSPQDLVSQAAVKVPDEISASHIFRDAVPRVRKPDILISPRDIATRIAVVEEKARQTDLEAL